MRKKQLLKQVTFNAGIIVALLMFGSVSAYAGDEVPEKTNEIQSAFNPKTAAWEVSWPGRIAQYDLVYQSPPVDPMQGIPLGNGETGVLFWCEESRIIAEVNKSDLWDDAPFGPFHNWSGKEEDYSTTLRHACRIVFEFHFPVFSTLYLSDFKARLNLADGSMDLDSQSPFGKVSVKAFVDHQTGILFCNLSTSLNEDVPVDISVEHFGSRTYSHWYRQINRDASIGLSGTEAYAGSDKCFVTQKLSSGTFAAGASVLESNGLNVNYSREHSHRVQIGVAGKPQKSLQLAFDVTSPTENDPSSELRNTLLSAKEKGFEFFQKLNAEAWKSIWNRSFMDYGDDYLNNLWYLTMFYANASQGGKYPGRFNNGLWSWDRDVQNWNFYFHWNQQQIYWPLNAAGFPELVTPYLDYRFNSLPQAKKDAKEMFNTSGAFISDVTERRGYNSTGEHLNHTPVAEIALDFWRQYQFTCDKQFLKEKALPFIIEAARFYESLFVKEADGLYHAKEGTGYEGWIKLKDGLTELVYARALFSIALSALQVAGTDLPEAKKWKEILEHLVPLPAVPAGKEVIEPDGTGYQLWTGFFKGKKCPGDTIFCAGWGIKENKWLTVFSLGKDSTLNNGLKLLDGIFPSVPSSPVFPSGLIGLSEKGTDSFKKMSTTALLYGSEGTGWDPVSVVLARLGFAEELAVDLARFPSRWQIYCNGWGHWGLEKEVNKDAEWFFRTNMVRDVAAPNAEKFPLSMWPFRHMSMESMSVLATAMNESLLQSYDGIVRVFPAFPAKKDGRFTLHAKGGFIVSSEMKSGEVQWICIQSLHGNVCRLELPWRKAWVASTQKRISQKVSGKVANLKTKEGEILVVVPEGKTVDDWMISDENPKKNEKVKYHSSGKAQLGLPRMF